MSLSRIVFVTSLALSCTGCLSTAETPVNEDNIQPPRFKTLVDPGGGIGTNGLDPQYLIPNLGKLLNAMDVRLTANGTSVVSEGVLTTGLLDTKDGAAILKYAVKCAVPFGQSVTLENFDNGNDVIYPGQGLLTTTSGWTTSGLALGPKQDILECLIAHLNPSAVPVDIFLSGYNVAINPDNKPDYEARKANFTFDEAVWGAKIDPITHVVRLGVWPMSDLEGECQHNVYDALQTRVCGEGIEDCGVTIRQNLGDDCDVSMDGHYTCDGVPAIRTRLEPWSVSTLYGGCSTAVP